MGLDIAAYRRLEPIGDDVALDKYGAPVHYEDFVCIQNSPDFAGREAPLIDGQWYRYDAFDTFRAGSYSGYGEWRDWLAKVAGYRPHIGPRESDHPNPYAAAAWSAESGPFWELINFSDCEGVIGSEVATKLTLDFDTFAGRAKAQQVNGFSYFASLYDRFRDAFRMAADGGCVVFR